MGDSTDHDRTRRIVLKALGATGATAALGGLAASQEGGDDDGDDDDDGGQRRIILGGETDYWFGIYPDAIQGEENPTLAMEPGEQYSITWLPIDEETHQFQILDDGGDVLVESDEAEGFVSLLSIGFSASEEMATYRCGHHPDSMRGEIRQGTFETATTEGGGTTGTADTN